MILRALRFLATAAIASAALLYAEPARATSEPCGPFAVLDSNVADGETSVPRDARLVISYKFCGEPVGSVVLLRDGVPVDSDIEHGATDYVTWTSVKPKAPLEPNTSYVLEATEQNVSSKLTFTTGDASSTPNTAKPTVSVVSSTFTSPLDDTGFAVADFDVEIRPATPTRGGVAFLRKTASATPTQGGFAFVAQGFAIDHGQPAEHIRVTSAVRPGEAICFSGTYEDQAGNTSEPTDPACATVAGTPPPAPAQAAPTHASGGSCSAASVPTSNGWTVALLTVALALVRRRTRASRALLSL